MGLMRYRGMTLGAFGGVAGFFALFFFTDIPRVRKDIVQKIPIIGPYYVKEVPASDNVGLKFLCLGYWVGHVG
jgi:Ubiquinol-cytochrome-c reductase complex subunit (QCR10)